MTTKFIEQRVASNDGDVFETTTSHSALIYTNTHDMLLGCSNSSNYISLNESNTFIGGDVVINGDIIKKNSDGSTVVINNRQIDSNDIVDASVTTDKIADSSVTSSKVSSTTGSGAFVLADSPHLTGNVGIGNNNPQAKLHVSGHTMIDGDLAATTLNVTTINSTQVNSSNLAVESNMLTLNNGETGAGITAGTAGIEIERGTANNFKIVFDESTDKLKIGIDGSLENVATEAFAANGANITNGTVTTDKIADSSVTSSKVSSTTGSGAFVLADAPTLSGNVGIEGTLDLRSGNSLGDKILLWGSNNYKLAISHNTLEYHTDSKHSFSSDKTEKMMIGVSGIDVHTDFHVISGKAIFDSNVGIGTNNPQFKLHVNGDAYVNGDTRIIGNVRVDGDISKVRQLSFKGTSGDGIVQLIPYTGITERQYDADIANTQRSELILWKAQEQGGDLGPDRISHIAAEHMWSIYSGASWMYDDTDPYNGTTTTMIIKNDGNVGIGTTTPTAKLHVAGDIQSSRLYSSIIANTNFNGTPDNLTLTNTYGSTHNYTIGATNTGALSIAYQNNQIGRFNAKGLYLEQYSALGINDGAEGLTLKNTYGNGQAWRIGPHSSGTLDFSIDANRKVVFDANGNVGIGTTTPTVKLHVNGDTVIDGELTAKSLITLKTDTNLSYTEYKNNEDAIGMRIGYYNGVASKHGFINVRTTENLLYEFGTSVRHTFLNNGKVGWNTGDVDVIANFLIQNPAANWINNPQFLISSQNIGPYDAFNGFMVRGDYTTIIDTNTPADQISEVLIINASNTRSLTLKGNGNLYLTGAVFSNGTQLTSDDRVKSDEVLITNALDTVKKIHPQEYNKWNTIDYASDSNATSVKESGIIAQELYIDVPELRHLVVLPTGSDSNAIEQTASNYTSYNDLQNDPDWPEWSGDSSNANSIAYVNYTGLIPYTIQAIKELSDKLDAKDATIASLESRIAVLEGHHA